MRVALRADWPCARRLEQAKDLLAREVKEAREAEAARWGPSASELRSMPSLQEQASLLEQARRARAAEEEVRAIPLKRCIWHAPIGLLVARIMLWWVCFVPQARKWTSIS